MEALAALGLASNIISFVDFAWKLLADANEIYASGTGVSSDVEFLDKTARDVNKQCGRIKVVPEATNELKDMAHECDEISQKLLESLEELKIQGNKTKLKSAKVAFKGFRSKHKMEQLNGKISKVQERISAHIQELLLDEVHGLGGVIADLQKTHVDLGIATKNEIESLKQEIQTALKKLQSEGSIMQTKVAYQQRQPQEIGPVLISELSGQMQGLAHAMESLQAKGVEAGSNQQLLKKLYFTSISTRERKVEKAHTRTLQWLVTPDNQADKPSSCLDFITWLRSGDGVFWVHGKPGSGKSTFMKFAFAQESVTEHLQHWAKGCKLVKASFYFWYAGFPLQKSLEGLLRTLLFEILRHIPDVMPSIIENPRLAVPLTYDEDWDLETLFEIYDVILHQENHIKFCFFIDGLDEFKDDEHRDIRDLTSTLHRLEIPNKIKLCMASRPWQEFEDVYGQTPSQSLKLEDLTRSDIHAYVSDTFNGHEKFMELRNSDSNYEGLIDEVVNRAQGVFLWVRLVVRQLLEGFTFFKSVQALQRQLASFPEDLDGYFNHMLNSIPTTDRSQAARILQVAADADQPRLLMFYHFLSEIVLGEAAELDYSHTPLGVDEVSARCKKMRRQLNGISRGLLEVTTDFGLQSPSTSDPDTYYFQQKVDFLHRTVRDFLVGSPRVKEFFDANIDSRAAPFIDVARAAVTQLKFADFSLLDNDKLARLVDEIFFYTRNAARLEKTDIAVDDLLAGAEKLYIEIVGESDWRKQPSFFLGLAAQSGHTSFLEHNLSSDLSPDATFEFGVDDSYNTSSTSASSDRLFKRQWKKFLSFFTQLLDNHRNRYRKLSLKDAMLDYALTPISKSTAPYIDTVQFLLSNGASSSKLSFKNRGQSGNSTIWVGFLSRLRLENNAALRNEYFAITKELIKHGADINDKTLSVPQPPDSEPHERFGLIRRITRKENWSHEKTPHDVLKGYFTQDELKELEMSVPRPRNLFGQL